MIPSGLYRLCSESLGSEARRTPRECPPPRRRAARPGLPEGPRLAAVPSTHAAPSVARPRPNLIESSAQAPCFP